MFVMPTTLLHLGTISTRCVTDNQEAAGLALRTPTPNKPLAVLSRAGFSGEDLATVAAAAARNAEAQPNHPAEPPGP
jgi:hypothetical protein